MGPGNAGGQATEDGWKLGQIPPSLEPLESGDGLFRDAGPYRVCTPFSGSVESGVKLVCYSEFSSELRVRFSC
jgi:hypothetical protein